MKICQSCGKEYNGCGEKLCSVLCRHKYRSSKILRICGICRQEFKTHPYLVKLGYGKYCSWNCKIIALRGHRKPNKICFCGKEFFPERWSKNTEKKYCSPKCQHESMKGKHYNKGIVRTEAQKLKNSLSRRGKYMGVNNHSWKGGITPENRKIRTSIEMDDWRKAVFKRDDYKCKWCKTGGKLHADHIKPFAWYPKLRFDIKNGQTLCKKCHQWKTAIDLKIYKK